STKLIHGGVRYLAQGNISLVYEALHERGLLLRNAPHLIHRQPFLIPCYGGWEEAKYLCGLKLYDWLSGRLSLGASRYVKKKQVLAEMPALRGHGLTGGVRYWDAQFNDARLAINLAQTAIDKGGVVLNYCPVTGLIKNKEGKLTGVQAFDTEQNKEYLFSAKTVINATGVYVDTVRQMDEPQRQSLVQVSQGIHLVVSRTFLPGNEALMIPKTTDGRVLFAVPWEEHVLIGTTDTPVPAATPEPKAMEEEVQFILETVNQYLAPAPQQKDVLSVFAGLRPLVATSGKGKQTKELSRGHTILVSPSNLITITGGKWTTYRSMAADAVNKAIETANLPARPCSTEHLKIHGAIANRTADHWSVYGSDATGIMELMEKNPGLRSRLVEALPYTAAEVVWAVHNELARTVEDVLARRLRLLFLNAGTAITAAPQVARLMRHELGKDEEWEKAQLEDFYKVAENYLPKMQATAPLTAY
ncbi:MAG: glycerol-3-phosphate dehydrogenase/oxidase, partial [Flavisolibacter sp.]|nr:glycerol-3-phosphate dehydrogenase/oxidase [Flavisolibacter sp.]